MVLLTDEYKAVLEETRVVNPKWGNNGKPHFQKIKKLVEEYREKHGAKSLKTVLDYGCGLGVLLDLICEQRLFHKSGARYYDPGIPEFADGRRASGLLISTDVLEHIEPECLDDVLDDMRSLALKAAYINIHHALARQVLPDGRNAHLIVEPPEWWVAKLKERWGSVRQVWGQGPNIRTAYWCE